MPVGHGNKHYLQELLDNGKYQDLEQCVQERGMMTIAPETLVTDITYQLSTMYQL